MNVSLQICIVLHSASVHMHLEDEKLNRKSRSISIDIPEKKAWQLVDRFDMTNNFPWLSPTMESFTKDVALTSSEVKAFLAL